MDRMLSPNREAQTVIVTGASAGIGRAVAHRFAQQGYRVGLIARDAAALDRVQQELQEFGTEVAVAPADVADADAVFAAAHGCWREYWLGVPTLLTILGNTVLPGFMDRYLAKNAVKGQQTEALIGRDRRDNLDAPITPLHRTRGSFSAEASTRAPLLPGEVARVGVVAAGALLFFALGAALRALPRGR